jgi:hypothetical protein
LVVETRAAQLLLLVGATRAPAGGLQAPAAAGDHVEVVDAAMRAAGSCVLAKQSFNSTLMQQVLAQRVLGARGRRQARVGARNARSYHDRAV